LDFSEDNVHIKYDKGDVLTLDIESSPDGTIKKRVDFQPSNKNELVIQTTVAKVGTGRSYEDVVGQLNTFLQHSKIILWAGIGFLAAGGLLAGIFKDIKSGMVLVGIGTAMLGGYALLPQIYSNWLLILSAGVVIIPVFWYFTFRQTTRINEASTLSYERMKVKHPDIAKEMSTDFKILLPPKDIQKVKKLKKTLV